MKPMTRVLTGAALVLMGTASLAAAFPGESRGDGPQGQRGHDRSALMLLGLDTDGDGAISAAELEAAGPAAAFAEADADADGMLTADELTIFRAAQEAAREARRSRMMIGRLDTDGDGRLTLEDLSKRSDRRAALFERADTDGDGTLSAEELDTLRADMRDARGPRHGSREGHGDRGHWQHHGKTRGEGPQGPREMQRGEGPASAGAPTVQQDDDPATE
ncbi:hypothetical protein GCM10011415_23340 [Salipiger pallidus]|uniref:EF-hand domain-containing protein n=1 Tax=Salipiger pallidus TaxID=1775170 RepID=A0A8J2ZKG5_9RHOB|nr:EF-hand domain-containing protein [Salipiger pallidus]GGG74253.1 hypothetical protein GCM10011415_23340 [Salipiger pallidus]